jgi:hypothetical protein
MSSDLEKKGDVQYIDRTTSGECNDDFITEFTLEEQKNIIYRVDRRLVTTLGVLYMCSLIDTTNLAGANIAG